MLQCILTGRAQEAYSALRATDCLSYAKVKSVVLKAYGSLKLIQELGKKAISRLMWNLLVICCPILTAGVPLLMLKSLVS